MGAQRRRGSRLRAADASRVPEAHAGLTRVHAPGQEGLQTSTLQEKLRPPPQGGPHAGKREFKDLQMTLFRFFSYGDRSPRRGLGRRGRKGQESASRLCSRLQSPLLPAPRVPAASAGPASLGAAGKAPGRGAARGGF